MALFKRSQPAPASLAAPTDFAALAAQASSTAHRIQALQDDARDTISSWRDMAAAYPDPAFRDWIDAVQARRNRLQNLLPALQDAGETVYLVHLRDQLLARVAEMPALISKAEKEAEQRVSVAAHECEKTQASLTTARDAHTAAKAALSGLQAKAAESRDAAGQALAAADSAYNQAAADGDENAVADAAEALVKARQEHAHDMQRHETLALRISAAEKTSARAEAALAAADAGHKTAASALKDARLAVFNARMDAAELDRLKALIEFAQSGGSIVTQRPVAFECGGVMPSSPLPAILADKSSVAVMALLLARAGTASAVAVIESAAEEVARIAAAAGDDAHRGQALRQAYEGYAHGVAQRVPEYS